MGTCKPAFLKVVILTSLINLFCHANGFAATANKCVQIYYDKVSPTFQYGRISAIYLQNLLGHFPNIQRYVIPIEDYKKGQLDRCYASFYLGYYFNNVIPADFFTDFVSTKKNVIWMQNNIWNLTPKQLEQLWSVKYNGIVTLDWVHKDANGQPGFFRFYQYKGQVFTAYGNFAINNPKAFQADSETILMTPMNAAANNYVVSWVRHSTDNQLTPFILHNQNHWFVSQIPFSYPTREGQYMIFADALFDMVGEEPRYKGKKPALVRIEDVNDGFDTPDQIQAIADLFFKYKLPFSIALIPIFKDPFGILTNDAEEGPITHNYAFLYALNYAYKHGASFIFEGVTHQYDKMRNPYNGLTGPDYEFWDFVHNKPLKEDSPSYFLNKLQMGADVIAAAGIKPAAWLTPHYRASILDYIILGQLFNWAVEDKFYLPYQAVQKEKLPAKFNFDNDWPGTVAQRAPYFESLKVTYPTNVAAQNQFFPYEIYGDYYGQRVMPENAGFISPRANGVITERDIETVDDMIRIIKKDTVLRDVWASFFIHPVLLNTIDKGGLAKYPGDTSELERLLKAIRDAGYQFISLDSWTKQHMQMAPEAIEVSP